MVAMLPALRAVADRTTLDTTGDAFRMTINGKTVDKRPDAVEALRQWTSANAAGRPPIQGSKDLGIIANIAGHDIRYVQKQANMLDIGASKVELQVEGAPGVAVELKRTDALFPTVGVIQRLENQVRRLPEEVTALQNRIEEARQEYRDAATALREPFKHGKALEAAKWDVERIGRAMRGEDPAQTTLAPDLEALKRATRSSFPTPPTPGGTAGGAAKASPSNHRPGVEKDRKNGIGN